MQTSDYQLSGTGLVLQLVCSRIYTVGTWCFTSLTIIIFRGFVWPGYSALLIRTLQDNCQLITTYLRFILTIPLM